MIQPGGFTAVQLVVMALVAMLYLPCLSTIAVLGKEFGWKAALTISAANIAAALLIGGLAYRILTLFV
jgi:ferrous iron transport protein B